MERLAPLNQLSVKQKKEWGEILTGFEMKNAYTVTDAAGREVLLAAEEGGSTLARLFLKALRPFEMLIAAPEGAPIIRLHRPFRFYFHEIDVTDAGGNALGSIKKRFAWVRRRYDVLDARGALTYTLFGPILKPWTFFIRRGDTEVGTIAKKWSGLGKEAFTKADNFGIEFPSTADPRQKAVLLGAVFLIDFVHFESKGNG
jgi:uncharacterized protein YxjI